LLKDYADHVAERATKGIPPLPLNAEQTNCVTKLLEQDSTYDSFDLLDLLINRVPPGVDEAAYVKASWLTAIINSEKSCKLINPEKAIEILGTMIGGYNVNSLVEILKGENSLLAKKAAEVLKNIILVYDSANEIYELSQNNIYAKEVVNSWAKAEWFQNKKILEKEIKEIDDKKNKKLKKVDKQKNVPENKNDINLEKENKKFDDKKNKKI